MRLIYTVWKVVEIYLHCLKSDWDWFILNSKWKVTGPGSGNPVGVLLSKRDCAPSFVGCFVFWRCLPDAITIPNEANHNGAKELYQQDQYIVEQFMTARKISWSTPLEISIVLWLLETLSSKTALMCTHGSSTLVRSLRVSYRFLPFPVVSDRFPLFPVVPNRFPLFPVVSER